MWLRADLGITLNGGNVSAWGDQSGSGNNVTQGTSVNQPSYNASDVGYGGHPSLSFAGQQFVQNAAPSISQPMTLVSVGQCAAGNLGCFLGTVANNVQLYANADVANMFAGTSVSSGKAVTSPAAMAAVVDGSSSSIYVDASASPVTGNAGANVISGVSIGIGAGSSNPLTGQIAEVLLYSRALSQSEVAQLFRYFASRYGGAWS